MATSLPIRAPLPEVTLPDGTRAPALGLGTWHMGEKASRAAQEAAALRLGLDLGMRLIDTAELYGNGGAETVVGRAMAGRRDEVFLVSKVLPQHGRARETIAACEQSLQRLRTDRIDLYLLHWRGSIPLAETVGAFERLRRDGKIRRWGVSNFDVSDMQELFTLSEGDACATNQLLYHLGERGIEWSLLPWLRAHRIPVMAYSPLGQGELLRERRLIALAGELQTTPAALVLAWLVRQGDIMAIPQSHDPSHLRENREAATLELDKSTLTTLDAMFPPPRDDTPLAMI